MESPPRHIKNSFPPETRFGCENYAKPSVYNLFTASCLGLAWQFADDSIAESPAPAEIRAGYVLEMAPAFHKIFATVGDTQIEIDTAADLHYDATGLGRFTRAGAPLELALSVPIPQAGASYQLPQQWQRQGTRLHCPPLAHEEWPMAFARGHDRRHLPGPDRKGGT